MCRRYCSGDRFALLRFTKLCYRKTVSFTSALQDGTPPMKHTPSAANTRLTSSDIKDIRDIFSEKTLQLMQSTLSKVTGLSLSVTDGKGSVLAETAMGASLCRSLKRDGVYGAVCSAANKYGLDMASSEQRHFIFFCPCGLVRAVIPVIHGNRCLGGFFIGQIRSANAPETTPNLKRLLKPEHDAILRKPHIHDLFTNTPVYDFSYFTYIVTMIETIVNETIAKETAAASRDAETTTALAMLRAKTTMLEQELSIRESTLAQWRSQMNLDFFINALSSLSGLASIEDSPRTQEMCLLLAEHLRHRMKDQTGFVALREEMHSVNSFLDIQRVRLGERICCSVSLPPEVEECPFPAQTLLPFVEAALARGLAVKESGYVFSLTAAWERNEVVLLLRDNVPGDAFPGSRAASSALTAAILRLETLLGAHHEIRMSSDADGSTSCIRYTPPTGERA